MLKDLLQPYSVLLASASPRRQMLLSELDFEFTVPELLEIEEDFPSELPKNEVAGFLAQKKAQAYMPSLASNAILITADTIVVCNSSVLGKPTSLDDAKEMLRLLSGREHDVVTGVSLVHRNHTRVFSVDTKVKFRNLSTAEINYYVEKYQPLDKAGAYGIQEWIGYVGVESINGSYFNVMGLPVQRLYMELEEFVKSINPQ
jgi:septum formation protein